jgi:hypothetical protein
MDLVWEYADRYKHHPDMVPQMTWHEFVGGVERTGRYQVRDKLIVADGMNLGQPVDPGAVAMRGMDLAKLSRVAWPDLSEA